MSSAGGSLSQLRFSLSLQFPLGNERTNQTAVLDFSAGRGGEEMFGEWVERFVPNIFPV